MALPWIQVETELPDSPALTELSIRLGIEEDAALGKLNRLWCWSVKHAQKGFVAGLDPIRIIESAVKWLGPKGKFVESAIETGFLRWGDEPPGLILVIRGHHERYGALLEKAEKHAERMRSYRKASRGAHGARTVSAPDPTKIEDRNRRLEEEERDMASLHSPPPPLLVAQIQPEKPPDLEVFEHWQKTLNHPLAKFTAERRRAVQGALKAKYTVAQLKDAIDGCRLTPHNMGQNDTGEKWDDLELIVRNGKQIERFIRNKLDPPKPKATKGRATEADKDWSNFTPKPGEEESFTL